MKKILITGGAGFIGSHLAKHLVSTYPNNHIIVLDALTYAGNKANLKEVMDKPNFSFVQHDIVNKENLLKQIEAIRPHHIFHLAAESHVDRSILSADEFVQTNVIGTVNLLNAAKAIWEKENMQDKLFYHISTDEVYGTLTLESEDMFTEKTPYNPSSPYAASKASSDHFVRAYANTYNIPYIISNCSNNYGPNQYPEKLIPVVIRSLINEQDIPIYGKGENIRDWIFVKDHVQAIDLLAQKGERNQTYTIGGKNELPNLELVQKICTIMDSIYPRSKPCSSFISFTEDRPGHDLRYAIDNMKIKTTIGWMPNTPFENGLEETVAWYVQQFT